MALRSSGRRLSFEILSRSSNLEEEESLLLYRSQSDPIPGKYVAESLASSSREMPMGSRRKKKHKGSKRKRATELLKIPENDVLTENRAEDLNSVSTTANDSRIGENVLYENRSSYCGGGGGSLVTTVEEESVYQNAYNFGELRQRNVNSSGNVNVEDAMSESRFDNESRVEESVGEVSSTEKAPQLPQQWRSEQNGHVETKLETAGSLDWKRLMAEDPNYLFSEEKSPLKYFVEEMCNGNSLRSTTNLGTEKERERVYDTIFRLPWRCEALIDVGFFVCFDSFLSLLTIMPTRLAATVWRILIKRQFKRPSAAELSDFGCFLVLIVGVILLERTDISLIYHMIRGQGTIKLYVVYNVLEIFDKLCQNFCGDVLQTLFNSAEGVANCSHEKMRFWIWRFISDQALTMAASIFHSFILLAQAITLSTSIIAHNNALLALLVSNNFSEIKSNVFKRFSKDNIHSLAYADSIERFHISAFLLFVLAQNLLEAEGPWFESFLLNALMVFVCEMLIDIIKHSFLAKFNGIKPIAYSEFLEELCKQTLNIQSEAEKSLTFVPLAPACVVIRVLTPVFAAHLPCNPLPWRIFWILLLSAMTYIMLTSLKVLIGMGLQKHATWYVNRCRKRNYHLHFD